MTKSVDAQSVVQTVMTAFPDSNARPTPDQIEAVMRPFGVISDETEREIDRLLRARGTSSLDLGINSWMEANFVASGEGSVLERRIRFLLMDTCTCVLDHLPKAIEHATKDVDPRILGLLKHKYFQKK